jgi:hypothetical protein
VGDDRGGDADEAPWASGLLMAPVLVFLGIATLVGCLIRGFGELRLRAAARQPGVVDGDLCSLQRANRISTVTVAASVLGLVLLGLAYAVA